MELPGFPKDIAYKIFNKIPLYYLEMIFKNLEEFPEYFKRRALELYGIKSLESAYLSPFEKYVQLSSFEGEISKTSSLHVPTEKCFLYAAKVGNFSLMKKFFDIRWSDDAFQDLLQSNNLAIIKWMIDNSTSTYLTVKYNKGIKDEIYDYIFNLPEPRLFKLKFDPYIIGVKMPIEIIETLLESHIFKKTIKIEGFLYQIIEASISSLNYDRYLKINTLFGAFKLRPVIKYYMDDNPDIPEEFIEDIDPDIILFLGCPKIIKKYGSKIDELRSVLTYVPELSEARKLEMLNLAKTLEEPPGQKIVLTWWNWIVKGRYPIEYFNEHPLYREAINYLENYIWSSGNPKLMKNWMKITHSIDRSINLMKFPELTDIVINIYISNPGRNIYISAFEKNFTPELYLSAFQVMPKTVSIELLPNSRIAKAMRSQLEFYLTNYKIISCKPKFLEPLRWFEDKIEEK